MRKYYCDLCNQEMNPSENLIVTPKKRIHPCEKCMDKVEQYLELSTFGERETNDSRKPRKEFGLKVGSKRGIKHVGHTRSHTNNYKFPSVKKSWR